MSQRKVSKKDITKAAVGGAFGVVGLFAFGAVEALGLPVFLVALVLKLIHKVDWPWWEVTSPLWGGPAVGVIALIAALITFLI